MPVWTTKRFAAYALMAGLTVLNGGLNLACHHASKQDDMLDPPRLVQPYQTPLILATVGQPFTSAAPDFEAYYHLNGVSGTQTEGFGFSVLPPLPSGLGLDLLTGQIVGTPGAASQQSDYAITASNAGGSTSFTVTVGVQASSPVTLDYAGTGAVSAAVGTSVALALPAGAAAIGSGTGFGVSPALPAGLVLNPASGLVSGSPTAALVPPAQTFTLTVTTPQGSADASFLLVVTAAAESSAPLGLAYPGAPSSYAAGVAFDSGLPAFTSPAAEVVFTVAPPLPASSGLILDCATGRITGTPSAGFTGSYAVTASNAAGASLPVTVLAPAAAAD